MEALLSKGLNIGLAHHTGLGQNMAQHGQRIAGDRRFRRTGEKQRSIGLFHHSSPVVSGLSTVAEAGGAATPPAKGRIAYRIYSADGTLLEVGRMEPAAMRAQFDTEAAHLTVRALRAANPGQPGPLGGALIFIAFGALTALVAVIARGMM